MEKESKPLTLVEKLAKIRDLADVASKDKKGYGYSYVDISDILAKVKAGMKNNKVSLYPLIDQNNVNVVQNVTVNTKVSKKGDVYDQTSTEMMVSANINYKWVNEENPEDTQVVPWFCVGAQSDPSQALGTMLTYSMRQFLCNFFQIAQVEYDVDEYRKKQKEAEDREEKMILESLIQQVDTSIKEFVKLHPSNANQVKKFVAKYVKDSDYRKIKDTKTAGALLKDFQTFAKAFTEESEEDTEAKEKKAAKTAKPEKDDE